MAEKKKKTPRDTNNPTHATIMAVVGVYILYMAYQMVKNALSGNTEMTPSASYMMAGLLGLGGLAVIGYGIYNMVAFIKKEKGIEENQSIDEETGGNGE